MQNPFTTPLHIPDMGPNTGASKAVSNVLPDDYPVIDNPEFTGINGGPSTLRGNETDYFSNEDTSAPDYVRIDQIAYMNAPGIGGGRLDTMPAPGSVDLAMARESGGIPGTNRHLNMIGPVTGGNNPFSNERDELRQPQPGYNGAVSGGADYSSDATNNYYASLANYYSDQAVANSLLVAF